MYKSRKLFEVLQRASLFLEENHCEKKIAEILLIHHLQVSKTEFHMRMRETVPENTLKSFYKDLHEHVQTKVPVQYLIGYEYFYGRKFYVNENVLIPRPETEELTEHLIHLIKHENRSSIEVVDVGTGSGIIAVTTSLALSNTNVYATDLSRKALKTAEKNAKKHGAEVTFMEGSFLKPLIEQGIEVDFLVSNPPYIKTSVKNKLSKTVVDFEPSLALFAGSCGLDAYREIICDAPKILREDGQILFEIGYDQGKAVYELLKETFPKSMIKVIKDMHGKERMIWAKLT